MDVINIFTINVESTAMAKFPFLNSQLFRPTTTCVKFTIQTARPAVVDSIVMPRKIPSPQKCVRCFKRFG